MTTEAILHDLFCSEVHKLSAEKRLTVKEQEKIISVFQDALANMYMDEKQIYEKLTGRETS